MIYVLKGEQISIQVESKGAELRSLKDNQNNREYMWCADAKYWGKTSPILFPFIGMLKNGEYSFGGKTYKMTKHGFARDMEFALADRTDNSLVFALEDTERTREMFPFRFRLENEYRIVGKNLKIKWRVYNKDTKKMYFSIGGHPAFACPLKEELKRTDCYIKFYGLDEINTTIIDINTGLVNGKHKIYQLEQGFLPITESLFDNDALVLENHQTHKVSLCDERKRPYLSVKFDVPLFGVWSMPDSKASYVCIEPWYGRCDSFDFAGEIQDRDWTNSLEAGDVFEKEYEIKIEAY